MHEDGDELRRFEEEVQRNFRWNFSVNCVDFGLFTAALSFVSVATILPAFVKHFTASSVLIGAVSALSTFGWFLPQLIVAGYIERLDRKKPFVLLFALGERLPWLVLAEACGILAALVAAFAGSLPAFYGVFILLGAAWSSGMIAAWNMVLEFCRPEDRPTYIGLASTIKAPFMGFAPILGGILADRFGYPFVFLLTAGIVLAGLVTLIVSVRDPRGRDAGKHKPKISIEN